MPYWLSYGGGVNSTALAILLCEGKLPQYQPWRPIFADTMTEKDETYAYIDDVFIPYLQRFDVTLTIVQGKEGVLERWQRLKVTGSRIIRSCTEEGKIIPIERFIKANGGGTGLIGIDAGEAHRANNPQKKYPLVELDLDRDDCADVITAAGLPLPLKSGCWCCPFMRVADVIKLAQQQPDRMQKIVELEMVANETHGVGPAGGRFQFRDKPATYWMQRAKDEAAQYQLFGPEPEMPCECYDG